MRLICFFLWHKWSGQYNIRPIKNLTGMGLLLFPWLAFLPEPKECDRKCLRCGRVKTFPYNSSLGKLDREPW